MLLKAPSNTWEHLNTSSDAAPTASLDSLFLCPTTTLIIKNLLPYVPPKSTLFELERPHRPHVRADAEGLELHLEKFCPSPIKMEVGFAPLLHHQWAEWPQLDLSLGLGALFFVDTELRLVGCLSEAGSSFQGKQAAVARSQNGLSNPASFVSWKPAPASLPSP